MLNGAKNGRFSMEGLLVIERPHSGQLWNDKRRLPTRLSPLFHLHPFASRHDRSACALCDRRKAMESGTSQVGSSGLSVIWYLSK